MLTDLMIPLVVEKGSLCPLPLEARSLRASHILLERGKRMLTGLMITLVVEKGDLCPLPLEARSLRASYTA